MTRRPNPGSGRATLVMPQSRAVLFDAWRWGLWNFRKPGRAPACMPKGHDQGGGQGVRGYRVHDPGQREDVRALSVVAIRHLVMPPSFPEGGMGNSRLSFITPSVIVGDKSLVSVIAHELAHSSAGNLVGNATWRDLAQRGLHRLHGNPHHERGIRRAARRAWRRCWGSVVAGRSPKLKPADQILAIDLRDRDPADGFTMFPMKKANCF